MVKRIEPTIITDWQAWLRHAETIPEGTRLALDLETSGLSPWHDSIAVVGLYDPSSETAGILHFPRSPLERAANLRVQLPPELVQWLSQPERKYVSHNAVGFDAYFLWMAGVDVFAPDWFDTLVAEGVVMKAARRDLKKSLELVYKRRLGMELKEKIDHKTWQNPSLTPDQYRYVAGDIVYLPALMDAQIAAIYENPQDKRIKALAVETELIKVVMAMTINGFPIRVDGVNLDGAAPLDHTQGFRYYIETRMAALRDDWTNTVKVLSGMDINMNSPQQVKLALNAVGIMDPPSTDIATLTSIRDNAIPGTEQHAMVTTLMRLRTAGQRTKMYGTDKWGNRWFDRYVIPTPLGPVVRPRYWQVGTDTGRFSCSDPNMQQVGKDCRSFFGEVEGHLCLTADYSQLEVVITAWLANDEAFMQAVLTGDVHTAAARRIFGIAEDVPVESFKPKRRMAKAGVFTFLFGGGAQRLYDTAKLNDASITLKEAKEFEVQFFQAFPGLAAKREHARWIANNRKSHTVILPHGLIRHLAGTDLRATTIMNTEVQGGAASGLKFALLLLGRLGITKWLRGTIHDEVVTIAPIDWYDDPTDLESLYAEPTWQRDADGNVIVKGQLNRYVHWAMKQGMWEAFNEEKFGMKFPVKVGLSLGPRWHSDELPHTAESITKKSKWEKVASGLPFQDERDDARKEALALA